MTFSNRALVLFSGGQDSTTCLAWALTHYAAVETIGFDYGQRHAVELSVRPTVLQKLRALSLDWDARLGEDHVVDLSVIAKISNTALTQEVEIAMQDNGLPNTFVPGRNLLFMTVAAAVAYRRHADVLVGGMCETDFSGYPDCRDDTIKALQVTLNLGMATRFKLETPLMWIDKAQTWALANRLGGAPLIELIREDTHTCYLGTRGTLHEWGYGCGACPACELRARGYRQFRDSNSGPSPASS
ncbi:MAG: 7-cyano-7-deazaguanine synthase QueC [Burkholderiales bacterium]